MDKHLTEAEIEKILENLRYADQADTMAQKLFFSETAAIRQQAISNERINEVLNNIALTNKSASTRSEAIKTLKFLGATVVAVEYPLASKARDFALGFFGWFLVGNLIAALLLWLHVYEAIWGIFGLFFLLSLAMIIYMFKQERNWIGVGLVAAIIINNVAWMTSLGGSLLIIPFPLGIIFFGQ